jgi:hypothetical protein
MKLKLWVIALPESPRAEELLYGICSNPGRVSIRSERRSIRFCRAVALSFPRRRFENIYLARDMIVFRPCPNSV